ncbi:MAG TPA: 16S rRNA processing protein RimM [Bacteroidales bacterium]|nr:16S rRNA processing protein RimM [Bacteroidales bacterium]
MGDAGFVEIGFIQRTHGINGELAVSLSSLVEFNPEELESVFLEIEGIPVPFFITRIRFQNPEKAIVKFDDVDSIEQAQELYGVRMLIPSHSVELDDEVYLSDLVGYKVLNTEKSEVGVIVDYTEHFMNATFELVTPDGKHVLIPAADELIVELDTSARRLEMELPEGLIDLNL